MPRARTNAVAGSPALAAETVIAALAGGGVAYNDQVDLIGAVDITIGTSGDHVTLKVRRGTDTTGTVVATFGAFNVTAADRRNFSVVATDAQAAESGALQYVLTATVANGAATSTVNAVCLRADW